MKLLSNILFIAIFIKLKVTANQGIIGNLAFYGRGQRHLPNYWNDFDKIRGSEDAKKYFPYDESYEVDNIEELYETSEISDEAQNNPLVLYLPGRKYRGYSKIDFYVLNNDTIIDLTSFHNIKSEIKLVPPTADDLISHGYTCENIGLTCSDLTKYDFNENVNEWLSNVDIKFYLESNDANNEYDEFENYLYHYEIEGNIKPNNNWNEFIGEIDKSKLLNSEFVYTDLVFRNYGSMPVYVYIGNTVFLNKDPVYMVKEGEIQNNFVNWSWHQYTKGRNTTFFENQVYPDDPEQKQCVKLIANKDGDYSYFAHSNNGVGGPPEGISFRIRPMNDNQFNFYIEKKRNFNLTKDYLIHRNCKIPIGEETEFLIDVRSLVYSDPKFMLMNDVTGFYLQTYSEIKKIKKILAETVSEQAAEDYWEVTFFYDFIMHNTYPEDTSKYVKAKLFDEGPECNIELETHQDWGNKENVNNANPVIQWPDDISFETIFQSKNSPNIMKIDDFYPEKSKIVIEY